MVLRPIFSLVLVLGSPQILSGCAAADGHHHEPVVRHAATEPTIEFPGHPMQQVVKLEDSAAGITLFEVTVPARTSGPPPHIHHHEDEYFIVLEGELRLLNGDEVVTATPGTVATMTRGHQHTFWNNTDQPVRYLLGIAPGDFGGFFDEVVFEIRSRGVSRGDEIAAIIGQKAAERGVDLFPENIPPEQAALLPPPSR